MNTERDLLDLKDYLKAQPPGGIISGFNFLFNLGMAWECFQRPVGDDSNLADIEMGVTEATWQPPALSFTLRRDRGIIDGKTLFEIQAWRVDTESLVAVFEKVGEEYCEPPQARPNLRTTIWELVKAITTGRDDKRLRWFEDGAAEVLMERIVPRGSVPVPKMHYRWSKLRQGIAKRLAEEGWSEVGKNLFVFSRSGIKYGSGFNIITNQEPPIHHQ